MSLIKRNDGSIPSESRIARELANFNLGNLSENPSALTIEAGGRRYVFPTTRYNDRDFMHQTYISNFEGKEIRIVRPNANYQDLLGDTITFASTYSNGFAIHYKLD